MNPGRARFPAAVHLALAAALLAVWRSGIVAPFAMGLMAAALLWAAWRERRGVRPGALAERLGTIASLAYILVFAADLLVLSRNLLYASLRLLIFLSVLRLLAARTDRERVQLLLMSFLAVIAATASTTQLTFAVPLAAYTVAALWALACRQADLAGGARPDVGPVLRKTGAILVTGILLFFLIPHVGTGYFRSGSRLRQQMSGFSGRIELGSINRIKKNHEIVMRVRLRKPPPAGVPLRWRGRTFDRFDGRAWNRTEARVRWFQASGGQFRLEGPRDGGAEVEYEIVLEPIESRALFAAADPVRLQTDDFRGLGTDDGDGLLLRFLRRTRIRYRVASLLTGALRLRDEPQGAGHVYPPSVRTTYLQLPPLDPGISSLARQLAGGETDPYRLAETFEQALRTGYTYSLDVRDDGVADPLRRFLLEGAPGHCEYFATSMAILLRTQGVPSRVVTGFLRGDYSDLHGTFLVRQSDAHSWVEVYFPEYGWIGFDPTPAVPEEQGQTIFARLRRAYEQLEIAWDTWIVGLDLNDQAAILGNAREVVLATLSASRRAVAQLVRDGSWLPWAGRGALLLAGLAVMPWFLTRLRRALRRPFRPGAAGPEADALVALYRRFLDLLARRGVRRPPHLTPMEFARGAAHQSGMPREVCELTDLFCRARYGGEPLTAADLRRAEGLLRTLRGAPAP